MTPQDSMQRIDDLLSHVWMVRAFLKHCEEAEEDEDVRDIHRGLYDYMLALGGPLKENEPLAYLKQARKKYSKLKKKLEFFLEIQEEVSAHTNFQMAAQSLSVAVAEIGKLLDEVESS